MKLFFLAHANSVHSHRWIRFFAKRGHSIFWVSITPPLDTDVIRYANVFFLHLQGPVYRIPFFGILAMAQRLKKEITRFQPDIFHIHYVGLNGAVASFLKFHPLVVTAWGSDVLFAGQSLGKRRFVAFALRSADLITCDADHMKKAILQFGVKKEKITIIQFGIDTKKFIPGAKSKKLTDTLGIRDEPVIISLRTFEPIYDIASLINAFFFVRSQIPTARLILIGRGSQEPVLRALAKKLGIANAILFQGFVPNDELTDYLRLSDVYVSTSLSDAGIASSTAEAMACALPVVITDSGENRAWIENGKNGFLVPVKNPRALAEKIIHLLSDKTLCEQLGAHARKTIEERNDYYREMEKMESLYTALLTSRT